MKRIIYSITAVIIMLAIATSCSGTKESPIEDFEYEIKDGEIIITEYIGSERVISIPSKIEERPVTVIGSKAFEKYDLISVVIPDTVTEIKSEAFRDCVCLETIKFSEQLKIIGDKAFYNCEVLASVDLPKNLEWIGDDAFDRCNSLATIELPENVRFSILYVEYYQKLEYPFWPGTTIIVEKDSFAYEKIMQWTSYGLKYEIKSN